MSNGILPPELKSIESLLTGDNRFFVPKYQRSFAWGEDEIEELWDDIRAAADNRRKDYFLGTLVLLGRKIGEYEIIDGQQRMACITMVFSAIRNAYKAINEDALAERVFTRYLAAQDFSSNSIAKPKLELNSLNNDTFVKIVIEGAELEAIGVALKEKSLHKSNKDLIAAHKFFMEKISSEVALKGTKAKEFLSSLIDCVRISVKLITIPVTTEEDANLFFESLNARGKELAVSDLVKNRLYFEMHDNVERAQQLWEQMETELGRKPIPEFLRHYWIAKKAEKNNLTVREKKLYGDIAQEIKGSPPKALALLTDLETSARDYAMITDPTMWPDDNHYDTSFEESLNELQMFRISQCNPLLLNTIQIFESPEKIARVFRIIANFAFRYNIIGNGSPGNIERIFSAIAYGIRNGTHSSPRAIADELRAQNNDQNFRSDFELASIPKSKAKIARYILAKINNHQERKERRVNPDAKDVNLEHILPQSPTKTWTAGFSKGVDYREYIYRIGNLTLLNAKLQKENEVNKSFTDKQRLALKISELPINTFPKQTTKWNEEEIESRQKKMAQLALQIWDL